MEKKERLIVTRSDKTILGTLDVYEVSESDEVAVSILNAEHIEEPLTQQQATEIADRHGFNVETSTIRANLIESLVKMSQ